MYIGNIKVTLREILVSIIIALLMTGVGIFISNIIYDKTVEDSEEFFKALKIYNDEELFNYAINTNVGNILSQGVFMANVAVSDDMIDGEYFSIIRAEEHYEMKTREVTYTDGNGNVRTKTETYWEWVEHKRDVFYTETFNYLGREFNYKDMKFNFHSYNKTVQKDLLSNVRYVFYTIPREFEASVFLKANNNTITDNKIFYNKTIKDIINSKEKSADNAVKVFWVIWMVVILVAIGLFVALENKFINNEK